MFYDEDNYTVSSLFHSLNFLYFFLVQGVEVFGNCNAPKSVTFSAILYCLRCLVKQEIPLNQVRYYVCLISYWCVAYAFVPACVHVHVRVRVCLGVHVRVRVRVRVCGAF